LFREATSGWAYLRKHHGLLALLFFCALTDFMLQTVQVLLAPLVLTFAPTAALSTVLSIGGIGALVGAVLMSVWSGPRKRVYGLFVAILLQGSLLLLGGLQPNIPLITGATFLFLCCTPVIYTCIQTIWQSKIPIAIQGRVFAARRMTIWTSIALAYLIAGPLADYVFEPLLAAGGPLAGSIGQLIGVGPGRGIGLLFIVLGLLTIGITFGGVAYPRLRLLEDELPDVEQKEVAAEGQQE
jgi:MFS transporter, DHA3 family, macrolide efflux protein